MEKEFIINGKNFGWIRDGIFKKRVNSQKHKMKMFDAYGIEKFVVDYLDANPVSEIKIKEDDTGKVLSVSYEVFKEKRFLKDFQTPQYFLQMKYFT